NTDCQVICAPVFPLLRARRAPCPVISRARAPYADKIQNAELASIWIIRRQLKFGSWSKLLWHFETRNEAQHFGFGDLLEPLKEGELGIYFVVGAIEPVTLPGAAVNSQWTANGIPEFLGC